SAWMTARMSACTNRTVRLSLVTCTAAVSWARRPTAHRSMPSDRLAYRLSATAPSPSTPMRYPCRQCGSDQWRCYARADLPPHRPLSPREHLRCSEVPRPTRLDRGPLPTRSPRAATSAWAQEAPSALQVVGDRMPRRWDGASSETHPAPRWSWGRNRREGGEHLL